MSKDYKKIYEKWKTNDNEVIKSISLQEGKKAIFVEKTKQNHTNVNKKIKEWIDEYLI